MEKGERDEHKWLGDKKSIKAKINTLNGEEEEADSLHVVSEGKRAILIKHVAPRFAFFPLNLILAGIILILQLFSSKHLVSFECWEIDSYEFNS